MCDSSSFVAPNDDWLNIDQINDTFAFASQDNNELNSIFNDIFNNTSENSHESSQEFNDIIASLNVTTPEDFDIFFDEETVRTNASQLSTDDLLSQAISESIGDLNVNIIETVNTSVSDRPKPITRKRSLSALSDKTNEIPRKAFKRNQCENHTKSLVISKKTESHSANSSGKYTKSLVISKNPEPQSANTSYRPQLFFRGHCRNGNAHDSKTPIWSIKFKPKTKLTDDLKIAATCGGNIINIINVESGAILNRFVDSNPCEGFNCIAWNLVEVALKSKLRTRDLSIIVTGGSRKEARKTFLWFINEKNTKDFVKIVAHENSINCVMFHPTKKNYLYSCSWDNNIFMWDVDCSAMTMISKFRDIKITKLYAINCKDNRLLNIDVSIRYDTILIAGENGLQMANDVSTAALLNKLNKVKVCVRTVDLPNTSRSKLVDGLAIVSDRNNLFAFRYRQSIFIANLDKMTLEMSLMKSTKKGNIKLEIVVELKYTDQMCDYFYFSIESRLLACGDPSGRILLYAISDSLINTLNYLKVEPKEILEWPVVTNPVVDGKPVIDANRPKFINITAISPDLKYIVCGTSSNLLCIWKTNFKIPKKCIKRRRL